MPLDLDVLQEVLSQATVRAGFMAFLYYFLISTAVSLVLAVITAKAPESNLKAKGLDDMTFPTATEDRSLGYIAGRVRQRGPNLTWYGDYAVEKVTKKVSTGPFNTNHKNVTVGFRYYLGLELCLCFGPVDEITEIWFGDKRAWVGSVTEDYDTIRVYEGNLFGGMDENGGVKFTVEWYRGVDNPPASPYLKWIVGWWEGSVREMIRYPRICRLVFRGPRSRWGSGGSISSRKNYVSGWVGNNGHIPEISATLARYPSLLTLPYATTRLNSGANPAQVIYELVTGMYLAFDGDPVAPHLPVSDLNTSSLTAAAYQTAAESMGVNFSWQRDTPVEDIISDILLHINGYLAENPNTGLIELKLLRPSPMEGLRRFNRANILSLSNLQRQSIRGMVNRVSYRFTNNTDTMKVRNAAVNSPSGLMMSGGESSTDLDLSMFSSPAAANLRAQWHLNALSSPSLYGEMVTDYRAWGMMLGEKFILDWESGDPEVGNLYDIVCVVTKVNMAEISDKRITLGFVQDVFSLGSSVYGGVEDDEWQPPDDTLAPVSVYKILETPFGLLNGAAATTLTVFAEAPTEASVQMEVSVSRDLEAIATDPYTYGFSEPAILMADLPVSGQVNSASAPFLAVLGNYIPTAEEIAEEPDSTLASNRLVPGQTAAGINNTKWNMFLIDDEVIGVLAWTLYSSGGDSGVETYRVTHYLRGLYGTIPASHDEGARMWFLPSAYVVDDLSMPVGMDWSLYFRTITFNQSMSMDDVVPVSGTVLGLADLPYPPGDLSLSSSLWATSRPLPIMFAWNRRNKNTFVDFHSSQSSVSFGESYTLNLYNHTTNALLRTYTGTDAFWEYTAAMATADGNPTSLRVEIVTVVDTVSSVPLIWNVSVV